MAGRTELDTIGCNHQVETAGVRSGSRNFCIVTVVDDGFHIWNSVNGIRRQLLKQRL